MVFFSNNTRLQQLGIQLRQMKTEDHPFLRTLYAATRADEMALVTDWKPEQKQQFLEMQWQAQLSHYQDNFPQAAHDIILLDEGEAAGRLYVDYRPEEIRLLDISLLPRFRGRGVGSALLKALQKEAERQNVPLSLYVWENNQGARRLYERLGFCYQEKFGVYEKMEWAAEPAENSSQDHIQAVGVNS